MNNKSLLYSVGIGILIALLITPLLNNALLAVAIGVGIGVVAYFLQQRSAGGGGLAAFRANAYDELVKKARGDKALAERLVAYEMKKNPSLSRAEAAELALDRWLRDSR